MTLRPICEPVELPPGTSVLTDRVAHPPSSPELGRFLHFHDVSELVLFDRVEGYFLTDGWRHALADGAIAFIPSMRHHDFELAAGAKAWRLVQMDPYLVERLALQPEFARLSRPFCALPDPALRKRIDTLAEWLASAGGDPLVSRVTELLLIATLDAPEIEGSENAGGEEHVERLLPAVERLRRDPQLPLSLEDAAAMCSLSAAYFSRRFKHVFGMNFSDYARAYRLHLAARRIASSGSPISEIGYSLGFSSPSHFSAGFQERFGMSPRAYREGARKRPKENA